MNQIIALIPARGGSKRIKNKNIKQFGKHPLIAYTIKIAFQSKLFSRIIVSTESSKIAEISKYYGAEVPFLRPAEFATDLSPDIDWLKYTLKKLEILKNKITYFSILRPTNPFRSTQMILKAWKILANDRNAHSIRAIEKCAEHPAKMWILKSKTMNPVLKNPDKRDIEWFSSPYQSLPLIYKQNGSLEITKSEIPIKTNSISGNNIIPFITDGFEGYDINSQKDWVYAQYLLKTNQAKLPEIKIKTSKL